MAQPPGIYTIAIPLPFVQETTSPLNAVQLMVFNNAMGEPPSPVFMKYQVSRSTFPSTLLISFLVHFYAKSLAFPDKRRPMIRPKRPRTELKISMTRIFTNLQFFSHATQSRVQSELTMPDQQHPPTLHCYRWCQRWPHKSDCTCPLSGPTRTPRIQCSNCWQSVSHRCWPAKSWRWKRWTWWLRRWPQLRRK